jgi:hypothetical protein
MKRNCPVTSATLIVITFQVLKYICKVIFEIKNGGIFTSYAKVRSRWCQHESLGANLTLPGVNAQGFLVQRNHLT